MFPGQGSQSVGMGRKLSEYYHIARQTLQEVDDALGFSLSRIISEGNEEELTLTENAQPAILATSIAVIRVLESEIGVPLAKYCHMMAGHSLGEYTALVASEALSLEHGVKLVRIRGQTMQSVVPVGHGLMAALIGISIEESEKIIEQVTNPPENIVAIANDNAPGQIVISGHISAVNQAIELAKQAGCKRAIPLQTSAPFHCPLMAPVKAVMNEAFETTPLLNPECPIVFNVTAEVCNDVYEFLSLLLEQLSSTVRWRESILYMRDKGIEEIAEIGCGKVLSGLNHRIDKSIKRLSIENPEDVWQFVKDIEDEISNSQEL